MIQIENIIDGLMKEIRPRDEGARHLQSSASQVYRRGGQAHEDSPGTPPKLPSIDVHKAQTSQGHPVGWGQRRARRRGHARQGARVGAERVLGARRELREGICSAGAYIYI